MVICLKILSIFIFVSFVDCVYSSNEFGPLPQNIGQKKPKSTIFPSDVVSVSRFIQNFQRQLYHNGLTGGKADFNMFKDLDPSDISSQEIQTGKPVENETSIINSTGGSDGKNVSTLIKCLDDDSQATLSVELVNSTRLINLLVGDPNVTSRSTPAKCLVLMFYSRTCPFSCLAAPHYNALARAFPSIKVVAINAIIHQSFNTQFGIGGVPTVMLFHNGRPAVKFNGSEYTLEMFSLFITQFTGMSAVEKMFVSSSDFGGPVASVVTKEPDLWLAVSWIVVLSAFALLVTRSAGWKSFMEVVQSAWTEAQAHHDHTE